MVKKIIYLVLFIAFSSCTNTSQKDNVETKKEKMENNTVEKVQMRSEILLANKIEITLTTDFTKMSEDEVKVIYPDPKRRPDIIFRNSDETVNISLQHTKKKALPSELPNIFEQLTAQYKNNPAIEFISSQIESINDKDYVVLEFISQGENKKVYNLMLITSVEERVMMSAFTCAMPVINEWKETGNQLIRTIKTLCPPDVPRNTSSKKSILSCGKAN